MPPVIGGRNGQGGPRPKVAWSRPQKDGLRRGRSAVITVNSLQALPHGLVQREVTVVVRS